MADINEMVMCMQNKPVEDILEIDFVPRGVIDMESVSGSLQPFLPDYPETLLEQGNINQVRLLF